MKKVHFLSMSRPLSMGCTAALPKAGPSPANGRHWLGVVPFRKSLFVAGVATAMALSVCLQAEATPVSVASFNFNGAGFSGSGTLTYVPDVSPTDPNSNCGTLGNNACRADPPGAYAITGITGMFSDATDGIDNASITGLVPIDPANERDSVFDPRVPTSLSFTGPSAGAYSYDNLFFPLGNPLVCTPGPNSPISQTGTFVDVFGTAFTVAGGYTVDFWGDGTLVGNGLTYGVGVTQNGNDRLASAFAGVNATVAVPEPNSAPMFAGGLLLLFTLMGFGTLQCKRKRIG